MNDSPRTRASVRLLPAALLSCCGLGVLLLARRGAAQVPMPVPVLLWPNGAPGALGQAPEDKPRITPYLPAANPTHTGVIVAPGGGYSHLALGKEGTDIAAWLNARGVAAFVLEYRLGPKYHHPTQLGDAQRAVRLVRAHAAEYAIDPARLGVWGFSAGGHLAASAGTIVEPANPAAADPIDRQPTGPDFLILAYPVITMEDPYVHQPSRRVLLGEHPDAELITQLSPEKHVDAHTPPTFLFATTEDATVPVMNSVLFYSALVAAKVPAELHLYQHGPHGVGLAPGYPDLKGWPDLVATWMRAHGWMAGAP